MLCAITRYYVVAVLCEFLGIIREFDRPSMNPMVKYEFLRIALSVQRTETIRDSAHIWENPGCPCSCLGHLKL